MAATNAWLHWKLKNPEEAEKAMARYNFFESIANGLLLTDWTQYAKGAGGETEKQFRALFGLTEDPAMADPPRIPASATTCHLEPGRLSGDRETKGAASLAKYVLLRGKRVS